MSENKPPLPIKVEVLPPQRTLARDSGRPMVVSALYRVRNQVWKKELDSLAAKARSWNEVIAALRDGERLRQEYELALERSGQLPLLRATEKAKMYMDVQKIFDDEDDRQLERKIVRARAEADLLKANRALEALRGQSPKNEESRAKRRVSQIKRIREERDEMIAVMLDGRNEADVSDEDRELIGNMRLAADNEIKTFLEEGRA